MTKAILFILLGMLASCGSTPPRLPQAMEQAQVADKEARRALRSGDLLRAQHDFAKTLQLQQSFDDLAGAATTIINLATVAHQLHDDEGALIWLDKVLLENAEIYPEESRLAANFRKAVITANLGRLPEAEASLAEAIKMCDKKCSLHFGIDGLQARLLLLKGDSQGAITLALTVSKEAEAGQDEQANALRTVATAEEKLSRYAEALQHYKSTLEIDKVLSLGIRIAEDLSGMARVSKQLGRDQEAIAYSRRAKLANESLRQNNIP